MQFVEVLDSQHVLRCGFCKKTAEIPGHVWGRPEPMLEFKDRFAIEHDGCHRILLMRQKVITFPSKAVSLLLCVLVLAGAARAGDKKLDCQVYGFSQDKEPIITCPSEYIRAPLRVSFPIKPELMADVTEGQVVWLKSDDGRMRLEWNTAHGERKKLTLADKTTLRFRIQF